MTWEPSMKSSVSSLALAALAFTAIPAAAQHGTAARLTPYVGFLSAGSIADGPFGFEVGNAGAPVYGVQLGLNLTPNVAVVGNVGYSDSELQAGFPLIGGIGLADSRMLLYDAGLQLRLPAVTGSGTGFVPYVEGGSPRARRSSGRPSSAAPSRTWSRVTSMGTARRISS
jgi:hypothetical protein